MVLYIFRGYCIKLSIGNTFLSVHSLALCVCPLPPFPLFRNSLPCSQNSDQYLYLTAVTSRRRLSPPRLPILSFHFVFLYILHSYLFICKYITFKMKFLIAIVLYRIERKLTPLLKTNLSVPCVCGLIITRHEAAD